MPRRTSRKITVPRGSKLTDLVAILKEDVATEHPYYSSQKEQQRFKGSGSCTESYIANDAASLGEARRRKASSSFETKHYKAKTSSTSIAPHRSNLKNAKSPPETSAYNQSPRNDGFDSHNGITRLLNSPEVQGIPSTFTNTATARSHQYALDKGLLYPPYNTDTYLCLDAGVVTNQDFHNLTDQTTLSGWFEEGSLNIALDGLAKEYDCQQNGVFIAPSFYAQQLYTIGASKDNSKEAENKEEDDLSSYTYIKDAVLQARWLFFPINDGYAVTSAPPPNQPPGSHWSLLILDTHQSIAHYIDGALGNHYLKNAQVAFNVVRGTEALLNLPRTTYRFEIERGVPRMWEDNLSCIHDAGPCGPHIYAITKYLLQRPHYLYDEVMFPLVGREFCKRTLSFNSLLTRREVQKKITAVRVRKEFEKQAKKNVERERKSDLRPRSKSMGELGRVRKRCWEDDGESRNSKKRRLSL